MKIEDQTGLASTEAIYSSSDFNLDNQDMSLEEYHNFMLTCAQRKNLYGWDLPYPCGEIFKEFGPLDITKINDYLNSVQITSLEGIVNPMGLVAPGGSVTAIHTEDRSKFIVFYTKLIALMRGKCSFYVFVYFFQCF